jgi:ComF family protein
MMGAAWDRLRPVSLEIDAIVPVPLHARRLRERGFNQSALLARELGRHLGRPVVEDVLVRTKVTVPQVGLNAEQRHSNVSDAFRCQSRHLAGQQVLLVDDVCTTGATLEAACVALRQGGAASVWAYTLAHAKPGS